MHNEHFTRVRLSAATPCVDENPSFIAHSKWNHMQIRRNKLFYNDAYLPMPTGRLPKMLPELNKTNAIKCSKYSPISNKLSEYLMRRKMRRNQNQSVSILIAVQHVRILWRRTQTPTARCGIDTRYINVYMSLRNLFLDERKNCAPDKLSCLRNTQFLLNFVCVEFIHFHHDDTHVLFINPFKRRTCVMYGFIARRRTISDFIFLELMYCRVFFEHMELLTS